MAVLEPVQNMLLCGWFNHEEFQSDLFYPEQLVRFPAKQNREKKKLQVGDVVKMASGSPLLSVEALPLEEGPGMAGRAHVCWFRASQLLREALPPEVLEVKP